jgi:hypothetical protein
VLVLVLVLENLGCTTDEFVLVERTSRKHAKTPPAQFEHEPEHDFLSHLSRPDHRLIPNHNPIPQPDNPMRAPGDRQAMGGNQ